MNLLRESHEQTLADGFPVTLEVSHLKTMSVDLLYSFIEIWLLKNCKSPWDLSQLEEITDASENRVHTYIRIIFKDVREALYFKMGPHSLYNKSDLALFVCFNATLQGIPSPNL